MWQTRVTGCGVYSAFEEMRTFSDRAKEALSYGEQFDIPAVEVLDAMSLATAHLSTKALYDPGSDVVNHGVMIVGQLFVYVGPGLYISWEPHESGNYWLIGVAHIDDDGTIDDELPVPEEIRGTSTYQWHQTPGPELDRDPLAAGRFGGNLLHE